MRVRRKWFMALLTALVIQPSVAANTESWGLRWLLERRVRIQSPALGRGWHQGLFKSSAPGAALLGRHYLEAAILSAISTPVPQLRRESQFQLVIYLIRADTHPTVSCCEGEFSAVGQEKSGTKLGYLIFKGCDPDR